MSAVVRLLALWLAAMALAASEPSKHPVFEIRMVLDAPTADSEQMTLKEESRDKRGTVTMLLNVAITAALDDSAVKEAQVKQDVHTSKPQIEITMTTQGRRRLAELTQVSLNKRLAIVVGGRLLSAPVIKTEIKDGKVLVEGDFTNQEASELAEKINRAVRENGKNKLIPWTHGLIAPGQNQEKTLRCEHRCD